MKTFPQSLLEYPIKQRVNTAKDIGFNVEDTPMFAIKFAEGALNDTDAPLNPEFVRIQPETEMSTLYQQDVSREVAGQRLRSLRAQVKAYRRLVRDAYAPLTQARYNAIVRRHTRMQLRWVRVKPYIYQEVLVPPKEEVKRFRAATLGWLDKLSYLRLRLDRANRPEQRQKLLGAIQYLQTHPECNVEKFRCIETGFTEKVVRLPPGSLGRYWRLKTEKKLIPVRDWDAIWQSWSALKRRCASKVVYIQKTLLKLEDELEELRSRYYASPKRCWHSHQCLPFVTIPTYDVATKVGFTANVAQPAALALVADDQPTFYNVLLEIIGTNAPSLGQIVSGQRVPAKGQKLPWIATQNWGFGSASYYYADRASEATRSTVFLPEEQSARITSTERIRPSFWMDRDIDERHPPIVDLSEEGRTQRSTLLAERRITAKSRLLNLKTSRSEYTSTWERSLAEQKDNPELIRSVAGFSAYVKGGAVGYSFRRRKSTIYTSRDTALGRLLGGLDALTGSERKRRLQRLGITALRPVTARTWAVAAALYLSWKFGVEQSIQDAQYFLIQQRQVHQSFARPCLAHLKPNKHGVLTPRTRYAEPLTGHSLSAKKVTGVETDLERPVHEIITDRFDLDPLIWAIRMGDYGDPGAPSVISESSEGFPIFSPMFFNSWSDFAVAEKSLRTIMVKQVGVAMTAFFKRHRNFPAGSYIVYVDRRTCGSIFASFSRRNLTRASEASVANLVEESRLLETAWELAPLSFIVDWFTNVGVIVRNAQELASATSSKLLKPITPAWETLTQKIYRCTIQGTFSYSIELQRFAPYYFLGEVYDVPPSKGDTEDKGLVEAHGTIIPGQVLVKHHIDWEPASSAGWLWEPARTLTFSRQPYEGDLSELPDLRFRLNLNPGKLGSLLAMWMSSSR